jgi:O-antigen/teichoic acid export membrane protein
VFGFSAWLGASSAVNQINWQSDNFMVGALLGKGTLGQMSMGGTFVNRIDEITRAPLFRSLFSAFSSIQSDPERLRRAYLSSQAVCVAALLPIGLGLGAVAQPLVLLVLGDKWGLAAIVAAFCGVTLSVNSFTSACQPLAMSMGQTRALFFRDLAGMFIRVSSLLVGLITGGPIGLLIGLFLSTLVMVAINATLVKSITGVSLAGQVRNCRRSLIAGGLMFFSVYALSSYVPNYGDILIRIVSLGGVMAFGAFLYAACHLALWRLDRYEDGPETRAIGFLGQVRSRFAHADR